MQHHSFQALAILICMGLATFGLGACSHTHTSQETAPAFVADHGMVRVPPGSPLRQRLRVQAVSSQNVDHALSAPAMVEADPAHTVNVLAPLTGRVVELPVKLGDHVKRGQVLAVIASGDYAQAVADERKADDALALARRALARAEGVQQAGGAAQKDLETARSAYVQAQAEAARARARLASVGGGAAIPRDGRLAIVSPADGSITALTAAVGGFINDPTAPLMTVTDLRHVWVTANVAENDAEMVSAGMTADVVLPGVPGGRFRGTVQSVSDVLDADSRRVKVRIAVPQADGTLKVNMFATATFQVPQPHALLVPQSALLMNNDSVTVFVEIAPWTFARRPVELGVDEGDRARILKGLRPGERVIVAGGVLIND